jgi:hypothetical protein
VVFELAAKIMTSVVTVGYRLKVCMCQATLGNVLNKSATHSEFLQIRIINKIFLLDQENQSSTYLTAALFLISLEPIELDMEPWGIGSYFTSSFLWESLVAICALLRVCGAVFGMRSITSLPQVLLI